METNEHFSMNQGIIGEQNHENDNDAFLINQQKNLIEKEIILPPETQTQLSQMIDAIQLLHGDLGINAEFNKPSLKQIHFYQPETFDSICQQYEVRPESTGALIGENDVVVKNNQSVEENLYVANHELIHLLSKIQINSSIGADDKVLVSNQKVGLSNDTEFVVLNEAITELTNTSLIKEYWRKFDSLRGIEASIDPLGYKSQTSFVKKLLVHVAKKTSMNYDELLNLLQKEMFTGIEGGLATLTQVIGESRMERIAHIPEDDVGIGRLERIIIQ